jgi:hypothetical protein
MLLSLKIIARLMSGSSVCCSLPKHSDLSLLLKLSIMLSDCVGAFGSIGFYTMSRKKLEDKLLSAHAICGNPANLTIVICQTSTTTLSSRSFVNVDEDRREQKE